MTSVRPIIPNRGEWLLVDCSSDTVYNYVPEKNKLVPFFVKAPTKDPEILLTMGLSPIVIISSYCKERV